MVASFLREHELDGAASNSLLHDWVDEFLPRSAGPPEDLAARYSISRVVRASSNPLRSLLLDGSRTLYRDRAASTAGRLTLEDLIEVDGPARTDYRGAGPSRVLNRAIRTLSAGDVRWSASRFAGLDPAEVVLGSCPNDFTHAVTPWGAGGGDPLVERFQVCAENLPEQVSLRMSVDGDGMLVERRSSDGMGAPSVAGSMMFMFFPLRQDPPAGCEGLLVDAGPDRDGGMGRPDLVWLEFHSGWNKTKLNLVLDGEALTGPISTWRLDDDQRRIIREARDLIGSFNAYLGYDPGRPTIGLRQVSFF